MSKLDNTKTKSPAPSKRRKRRSTAEIIDRITDAAFLEFSENGYTSATTSAIARRAEVAEALIFTHFGSKTNLFRKAVFKPLDDHFSNFINTHTRSHGSEADRLRESREFVSNLVAFIRRHSGMFKSLVVNEAYGKEGDGASGLRGLQDYFEKMSSLEDTWPVEQAKISPPLVSRISFASILGCILFNDWLFPQGLADDDDIHEGICDFIMEGLSANPSLNKAGPALTSPRAARSSSHETQDGEPQAADQSPPSAQKRARKRSVKAQ